MGDPRRLIETDALARQLYAANRADAAPPRVRTRVLRLVTGTVAAGIAGTGLSSTALASGASGLAPQTQAAKAAAVLVKVFGAQATALKVTLSALVLTTAGAYGGFALTSALDAPDHERTASLATPKLAEMPRSAERSKRMHDEAPVARVEPSNSGAPAVSLAPSVHPVDAETLPLIESEIAIRRPQRAETAGPQLSLRPQGEIPSALPSPVPSAPSLESSRESSLRAEIALVSRARKQLNEGRLSEARQTLDEFRQRFPKGKLLPEAIALSRRVQASAPVISGPASD